MFIHDRKAMMRSVVAVWVVGSLFAWAGSALGSSSKRQLSDKEGNAVILAVEDEVYDRGYQKRFYMVGPETRRGVTQLPLYIRPTLEDGEGLVIYILMPLGEVIRGFHFSKEGLVVLEGDPDGGFPPTDPDMLTIYVDDDNICRWKHTWKKYHFEIIDSPAPERIDEGGIRQKQRVGYSYREMPSKEQRRFPPE
jgi:hypothetical protein